LEEIHDSKGIKGEKRPNEQRTRESWAERVPAIVIRLLCLFDWRD
jgi:hypothetical protein